MNIQLHGILHISLDLVFLCLLMTIIKKVMRNSSSLLLRSLSSVSSKQEFLLVNAVGMDRPGIVSDITHQVTKAGGNIGSSQSSKLGSHFGLMMLVSVPQEQSQSLQTTLANMDNGMTTSCFITTDPNSISIEQPAISTPSCMYLYMFESVNLFCFESNLLIFFCLILFIL